MLDVWIYNNGHSFHQITLCRLFYAGAVQGQMPEILSMIQVWVCLFTGTLFLPFYQNKSQGKHSLVISCISTQVDKSTPAPAVLIVVRKSSSFFDFNFATEIKDNC